MNKPKSLTTSEIRAIQEHFEKPRPQTRKAGIEFLQNHFRYSTMNSWNRMASYAHCIKVHRLPFPADIANSDELFYMIDQDEWGFTFSNMVDDFAQAHQHLWQVGTNGRSGGYLVLYRGSIERDTFTKTYCDMCGIRTGYVDGPCRKGGCNGVLQPVVNPRKIKISCAGVDDDTDFHDWDAASVAEMVSIVRDFDQLASDIACEYALYCRFYCIKEDTIMVEKKVNVLVER